MQHGPAASSGSNPKAPGSAGGYLPAIQTEALMQEPGVSKKTIEINRQCEEILKFIAEHL